MQSEHKAVPDGLEERGELKRDLLHHIIPKNPPIRPHDSFISYEEIGLLYPCGLFHLPGETGFAILHNNASKCSFIIRLS
jgi:hypothetical protein